MPGQILTVTDLNEYVRRSLAGDPMLRELSLRGEIFNFKRHVSGHLYFTLRDEQSKINCALFRQHALRLRFEPRDGMRVILSGSVGLYTRDGAYQFYAEGMRQDGAGELMLRFEELKRKLQAEGLFDPARKKPLPLLPRAVGIVTSQTGAVRHDIESVARRRFPGVSLILRPCKVQGEGASEDIVRSLAEVAAVPGVDVIIVGRGGGSLEDLWCFNEESVARAVAACPVPVISAVGHETDVTLCDFAADVRAATPSMAAELAVPDREQLMRTMHDMRSRLRASAEIPLLNAQGVLAKVSKRLRAHDPALIAKETEARLALLSQRMRAGMDKRLNDLRARLSLLHGKLLTLGPAQALRRGYAVAMREGKALDSARGILKGEELKILLRDGILLTRVTDVKEEDPFGGEEKL